MARRAAAARGRRPRRACTSCWCAATASCRRSTPTRSEPPWPPDPRTRRRRRRRRDRTPDSHDFPTRPYDLVKEFVDRAGRGDAADRRRWPRSSPRRTRRPITMRDWATAAPDRRRRHRDRRAGRHDDQRDLRRRRTTTPPTGQNARPAAAAEVGRRAASRSTPPRTSSLAAAGAACRRPGGCARALRRWNAARRRRSGPRGPRRTPTPWPRPRTATRPRSPPATTARCRSLADGFLGAGAVAAASRARSPRRAPSTAATRPARCCCSPTAPTSRTRPRAQHLGGDQWGMMNETGNYPGQPWMWLYTFWYQVKPFSTSDNADALVWGLMMVLTPRPDARCRSSPGCARSRGGSRCTG